MKNIQTLKIKPKNKVKRTKRKRITVLKPVSSK